jgi:hypothetical protein
MSDLLDPVTTKERKYEAVDVGSYAVETWEKKEKEGSDFLISLDMHIQPTATDPDSRLLLQAIKGTHKKMRAIRRCTAHKDYVITCIMWL